MTFRALARLTFPWCLLASITYAGQNTTDLKGPALVRAGWQAIESGQLETAVLLFDRAMIDDAQNAAVHLGAGLAAHLLGRETQARGALQRSLQINPHLTSAALLLGEIAYREGDLPSAIQTYEDALANAPGNEQLKARLERWRRELTLQSGFRERVGHHFTVLFEGPSEERLAERAVEVLESAYWRIGTTLGAYPPSIITVVLYTQEQFRDITRSPTWAAGAFDGKIRVPMRGALENPRELERVLAHEFTHALVRSLAARGVPTWLDEGLAVLFETGDLGPAERRVRESPVLIPLPKLETSFRDLTDEEARLAYAESALAARVLFERAGGSLAFLLQDLGEGMSFGQALQGRAFISQEEFQTEWVQRIR